jgi:catechol 2,3-dioxygenase-like lactoylglutathione lyase family enzyme
MTTLPLAHVSWAVATNEERQQCDAFFRDVFGAETAYEMLMTPDAETMGLDREERLMMIGDTMIIPIAAAGPGLSPQSPTGEMLRRNAGSMRWLGLALKVPDLKQTAARFEAQGFKLHYDPGMEDIYFLVGRKQALGVRLEIMAHDLPNDPRLNADWSPARWRDDHPLGIEGLQSVGVSAPSLEAARACFGERLELCELGQRRLPGDNAECIAFNLGDTVIEAMVPSDDTSPLANHLREVQGIYCITFKVRSAKAAADYLRGKGLAIVGDEVDRFAIRPDQAFDRLIYFTENAVTGYPPPGSKIADVVLAHA